MDLSTGSQTATVDQLTDVITVMRVPLHILQLAGHYLELPPG